MKIEVGRTYRAKKPRVSGGVFSPLVNDRTVLWIGISDLQYDGPAVARGRSYPRISIEKFIAWAGRDVTDELPKGEYAAWPKEGKPS